MLNPAVNPLINSQFSQALHYRIWLVQLALIVLLTPALTLWSQGIFALLLLAKLVQIYLVKPVWGLGQTNVLAALIMLVFLINASSLGVIHLMFHFLLLASLLRLLSIRAEDLSDYRQLLWVNFFLLACCFIVHQDLAITLAILLVLAIQLQTQYLLFAGKIVKTPWRRLLMMSMVFIPLFTSLFVFFPRLPPLWQLPGTKTAQTGLAEDLSPGSIEKLVTSDELAFRATFTGQKPLQRDLYWRAKIYNRFDGATWHSERMSQPMQSAQQPPQWHYTVIAEPHHQRVLYSLGQSTVEQGLVQLNPNNLVRAQQLVTQRISYQLASSNQAIAGNAQPAINLQLPAGNAKARALANTLKTYGSPEAMVAAIAHHLKQNGYTYTLSPTALSGDQIDQFLFETKAGFCSHYASATTFLLRAAGVPARIVGGYLGGEWQDNQQYLQVLQRDAHAWVEYYQDGFWYRFDPTAVVAPDRLENGLDTILDASELSLLEQNWIKQSNFALYLMRKLDDLDFYWSKWVIAFNEKQQSTLLQSLKDSLQQLSMATVLKIIGYSFLISGMLMLARWWFSRQKITDTEKLFRPICRIMPKLAGETNQQYLARLALEHPAISELCISVSQSYQRWIFGNDAKEARHCWRQMRQLVQASKQLRG